jgi:hypothetical protein
MQRLWGWWNGFCPPVCNTEVIPIAAPRCSGSAARVRTVSAAAWKEDVVDNRLILQRDAGDRRRRLYHHVEIRHRQQLGLAIGEPLRAGQTLAPRTVPVAAGIVGDAGLAAILIPLDMAELFRAIASAQ